MKKIKYISCESGSYLDFELEKGKVYEVVDFGIQKKTAVLFVNGEHGLVGILNYKLREFEVVE